MKYKAIACGYTHTIAIQEDDIIAQWGDTVGEQRNDFPEGTKAKLISASGDHSVAVREDGTMIQWGSNEQEQRKRFPDGVKVKAIACGTNHTVAIKEDDTLIQWGSNGIYGQYLDFSYRTKAKAVAAGKLHSLAIGEDDTVIQWGNRTMFQRKGFPDGVKVKAIACGLYHSLAIAEDGTLIQWGDDRDEQRTGFPVGVKVKAIASRANFSVAIKEDDTIVAWGRMHSRYPVVFPADVKATTVSAGFFHAAALKADGTLVESGDMTVDDVLPEPVDQPIISPIDKLEKDTPEELDPNPYPKFKGKIAIESLPRKSETYKSSTTAFDAIMVDDVKLDEVLTDEEKPLIVKFRDTYSTLNREYINGGITDGSLIRYGCNKSLGLAVYPSNVYGKNPLVYIKGLHSGNYIVLLSELDTALKDPSVKAIELIEGPDKFPTVASFASISNPATPNKNYNGQEINLVSADHCQVGSQQKVYSITVLDLIKSEEGGKRRRTYRKRGKKKTQKKRRSYKRSTK